MKGINILDGKCSLCKGIFSKKEMLKHLKKCVHDNHIVREDNCFWLLVKGCAGVSEYWLLLEVSARATLQDVDDFLRNIWLECCWHLSAFNIDDKSYVSNDAKELDANDMNVRIGRIFKKGLSFSYEYDFGSTTELAIKVVEELSGLSGKKTVNLLSRNEPPDLKCACGSNADYVCGQCLQCGEIASTFLCSNCIDEHGCCNDAILPVANSPRTGTCGYTGKITD